MKIDFMNKCGQLDCSCKIVQKAFLSFSYFLKERLTLNELNVIPGGVVFN